MVKMLYINFYKSNKQILLNNDIYHWNFEILSKISRNTFNIKNFTKKKDQEE